LIYGQVSSACLSTLRENEGHCLTYGQLGWSSMGRGGVWYITFLEKMQATAKPLQSNCKKTAKPSGATLSTI
jgi:hypothetical protein